MMDEFFVKGELIDFEFEGNTLKYKPVDAGDQLDWMPDYMDEVEEEQIVEGKKKKVTVSKVNRSKLMVCNMRNIVEMPISQETIKNIINVDKPFTELSGREKDKLFRGLGGDTFGKLRDKISEITNHKKKD